MIAIVALSLGLAFTVPLEKVKVPTTIEGHAVDLYLSGTAAIALGDGGAEVRTRLRIDLRDLQLKFPTIVRGRTTSEGCEYKVTTRAASLRWSGAAAEAAAIADATVFRCVTGRPVSEVGTETGSVRLVIDADVTADQWVAFKVATIRAEGSERLQRATLRGLAGSAIAEDVRKALLNTLTREALVQPLPENLREFHPKLTRVAITGTENGNIELQLDATLHVPQDKLGEILAWAMGGQ